MHIACNVRTQQNNEYHFSEFLPSTDPVPPATPGGSLLVSSQTFLDDTTANYESSTVPQLDMDDILVIALALIVGAVVIVFVVIGCWKYMWPKIRNAWSRRSDRKSTQECSQTEEHVLVISSSVRYSAAGTKALAEHGASQQLLPYSIHKKGHNCDQT